MLSSEISRSDLHLVSSEWRFEQRSATSLLGLLYGMRVVMSKPLSSGAASYGAKGLKPPPQFLHQPLQNFCVM